MISIAPLILVLLAPSDTPASPPALSAPVRAHLRAETLAPVAHVRDLPLRVREALAALFQSETVVMADPGEEFQATDVITKLNLPFRRLVLAGCSPEHCLVEYERGGIAHTYEIALFAVSEKQATLLWGGWTKGAASDLSDLKSLVIQGGATTKRSDAYW
jgi:hypothetical protein